MKTTPLERRLRFWLWWMERLEAWGGAGTGVYFWLVRRAASCNRWRKQ